MVRVPSAQGKMVRVEAVDPVSVCCPEALLMVALLSIGVPQHTHLPFDSIEEEIEGTACTKWRMAFQGASADGQYATADLIKWWHDPAWLAAHPAHEWTILHHGFANMAIFAQAIREKVVPRMVVHRGEFEAHIPTDASPARQQWMLDRLNGRVPLNTPFAEPEAA